jgi:hypothetical protein
VTTPPDIISRREFVLPCTDREALQLKLLRVLTEKPAQIDVIDQHGAILGAVVAYSAYYIEGSITHYPDRTVISMFLCAVDGRVIAMITKQLFDPSSTAPSIAKKASAHFWRAFAARFTLEGAHARHPLGSGHVISR